MIPTNSSIQYVINLDPLRQMKEFVKPFNGNSDDDPVKWIDSINHFFDVVRLPGDKDELRLQDAPAFLKQYAYRWWTEHKSSIDTWQGFYHAFTDQFAEKNEYLLKQQLHQRKQQPNESVLKYYYDMIDLCRRCDPTMTDRQKIRRLMNGLRLSFTRRPLNTNSSHQKQFLTKIQQFEKFGETGGTTPKPIRRSADEFFYRHTAGHQPYRAIIHSSKPRQFSTL